MRVVFDTNIVVSACFWRGAPWSCLEAWAQSRASAVVSPLLLAEYEEVFEELRGAYPTRHPVDWVSALRDAADLVFPQQSVRGVTTDPDDAMVLECALAGRAEAVVTGDKKHLLSLKSFRGIPVLSARDFLARLDG